MPTEPLTLDAILNDLTDAAGAWVLQEGGSGQYVIIPDHRFPGRRPVRFFMRRQDAEALLLELLEANPWLRAKEIFPQEVLLKPALRGIAMDTNPANADAFVVHSVNEVYEFIRDRS